MMTLYIKDINIFPFFEICLIILFQDSYDSTPWETNLIFYICFIVPFQNP